MLGMEVLIVEGSVPRLPSIGHRILNNKAPVVAARFKAGFWFGHADVTFLDAWPMVPLMEEQCHSEAV